MTGTWEDPGLLFDPDAEAAVLGAAILDGDVIPDVVQMDREWFRAPGNALVFDAIKRLDDRRAATDLLSVKNELCAMDALERVGGALRLVALLESVPSSAATTHHIRVVRRLHERHRALLACRVAHQRIAKAHPEDTDVEVARAIADLQGALPVSTTTATARDGLHEAFAAIDAASSADRRGIVSSGLWTLDELLGGFHPGCLNLIAARPSVGKSSLMTTLAASMSLDGRRVFYQSVEVPRADVLLNMVAAIARVDSREIRANRLSPRAGEIVTQSAGRLSATPLVVDDSARVSVARIRANVRRHRPIHAVFVDYLQLLETPAKQSREREVATISQELKQLAREARVPVIVACQLNRAIETRTDPTPRLSDLRDSGALEQDADVVVFLHSAGALTRDPRIDVKAIVAKNRNGPTGALTLQFTRPFNLFTPQDGPSPV